MDLTKYQSLFADIKINGEFAALMIEDWTVLEQLRIDKRDSCYIMFYFELMKMLLNTPGYSRAFSPDYEADCCVCSHNTPEKTIHLLKEYDIPIDDDFILKNNYTAPILTCPMIMYSLAKDTHSITGTKIITELTNWRKIHKLHLQNLV